MMKTWPYFPSISHSSACFTPVPRVPRWPPRAERIQGALREALATPKLQLRGALLRRRWHGT